MCVRLEQKPVSSVPNVAFITRGCVQPLAICIPCPSFGDHTPTFLRGNSPSPCPRPSPPPPHTGGGHGPRAKGEGPQGKVQGPACDPCGPVRCATSMPTVKGEKVLRLLGLAWEGGGASPKLPEFALETWE